MTCLGLSHFHMPQCSLSLSPPLLLLAPWPASNRVLPHQQLSPFLGFSCWFWDLQRLNIDAVSSLGIGDQSLEQTPSLQKDHESKVYLTDLINLALHSTSYLICSVQVAHTLCPLYVLERETTKMFLWVSDLLNLCLEFGCIFLFTPTRRSKVGVRARLGQWGPAGPTWYGAGRKKWWDIHLLAFPIYTKNT